MSNSVDCKNCSSKFSNFKHYIQHMIGEKCSGGGKNNLDTSVPNMNNKVKMTPTLLSSAPTKRKSEDASDMKRSKMTVTEAMIPQQQQSKSHVVGLKNGKKRCEFCMKMMKPRGMTQHLNMVHKCKYCEQFVENLDNHIDQFHALEPCKYCSLKFSSQSKVEIHVEEQHLRVCTECDDQFYTEASLSQHVEDVHASEYCDICDEKLRKSDNLMDEHKDKVHGIKRKVMKSFANGMMFMMVAE